MTNNRGDKLQSHKLPYARSDVTTQLPTLLSVVQMIKPTALIGLAGVGPDFTPEIISEMAKNNKRPIIFALSNPTSKSECCAKDVTKKKTKNKKQKRNFGSNSHNSIPRKKKSFDRLTNTQMGLAFSRVDLLSHRLS